MERYWENGKLVKRVYLPHYSNLDFYNKEAANVFVKYGYDVVPIGGLERAAGLGGALHCMVKVTEREPR